MLKKHKGVEKMRNNFDSKGENDNLNKRRSYKPMDESLFETIQFTEEELRKIRQPNNQPLDGDYFANHSGANSQRTGNESELNDGEENPFNHDELSEGESEQNSIEFIDIKGPPAPSQKQIITAPEDSEFHYKSPIKARFEQEIEQEKAKEDIEYWDEYEKSEMEFWNHTGETERVEEDNLAKERMSRTRSDNKRPLWKFNQSTDEQSDSRNKTFKKVKADDEAIVTDDEDFMNKPDIGKNIVDKVKSLLNGQDAVEIDEYIQETQQSTDSASKRSKQFVDASIKNDKNFFNRAKTAIDSRLSRSVEQELASDIEHKDPLQRKSDDIENEIKEVLSKEETMTMGLGSQESANEIIDPVFDEEFPSEKKSSEDTLKFTDVHEVEKLPKNSIKESDTLSEDNESLATVDKEVNKASDSDVDEEAAADLYSEKVSQETQRFSEPILTDQVLEEVLGSDDITIDDELDHQSESFVKGAAWLTIGSVFSRILGALYIIPWSTWLGAEYTQANTLYSAGYTPYSLFLAIATAGFPSAIAKQMAFYHSKKEYRVADKLFKNSIVLMLISGLFSGALLYLLAPSLASITSTDNPLGATLVIRSLVPALLILPLMSILRGYFQGFNDMVPSAISQIIEQIARVFYLLAATYAIMMVYRGEVTQAVVHSTFAAFIGALAALGYLAILYFKRLPMINKLKERSLNLIEIDFKESIHIMFMDSVPFILLGSGIILAQVIDTYTFKQILLPTTVMLLREISELYGAMSLDVNKLVMIVVSLAVALASSVVPLITSKFAARDIKATSSLIEQIVEVFSFVMLPAAIGMIGVSNNLYTMFYPQGHTSGPSLLITGSIMSISLGLYTVLSTVLQSMNFRRLAVRFLVVGLLVKIILQVPLVAFLHAHGAMIATTIAFAVSSVLMWIKIQREVEPDMERLFKSVFKIIIGTVIMGIAVSQWNSLLDLLMGEVGRFLTFVKVMLGVGMGIFVYGGVMGLLGQLSILLGDKKQDLQEKMRMF